MIRLTRSYAQDLYTPFSGGAWLRALFAEVEGGSTTSISALLGAIERSTEFGETLSTIQQDNWPELPLDAWRDTYITLHKWTQVVGRIRQTLTPPMNHWWHVTLYATARGLTTSPIPYRHRTLDFEFDFVDHVLLLRPCKGTIQTVPLVPQAVADFYHQVMAALERVGIEVRISRDPDTPPDAVPFHEDRQNTSYDAEFVSRWWTIMRRSDQILKTFRSRFTGKCSPVHFFPHNFDLTVTLFSGRRSANGSATSSHLRHVEADEEFSAGFWPGSGAIQAPAYYCFGWPEPTGFAEARIKPETAFYSEAFREYILLYEDVRQSRVPERTVLDFLQSTYEANAKLGGWNRETLESEQ